jgi:SsrA-binding protein
MARDGSTKVIALNRRARHDFELLDTFEAGLALTGTEVKALREGRGDIKRAFAHLRGGEAFLVGAHIGEYAAGNINNHEPERDRKLLLHRRELDSLIGKVQERNLTIVPTRLYFKDGRVKIELALARGKDHRDKRRDISEREMKRQLERAVKGGWREE